jgi:myo-inositol-1-phosphate synthase
MKHINDSLQGAKLGVLIVGLNGAVSTTFLAGTIAVRRGLAKPFGSITQMQTIRLGNRIDEKFPFIKDFAPLADLNDLVFGGWDIRNETCYEAARHARVLNENHLNLVKDELDQLKPMKGVFEKKFVQRLDGSWIKSGRNKRELAEALREDIRAFVSSNQLERAVIVWCGSTEVYLPVSPVHEDLELFEHGLEHNDPAISPSMIYAYAAISENIPYVNGAPNLSVDIPALMQLASAKGVPIAGKDFKTGQTLIKTVIAPMLKARMLGLSGWFSTNILGNRDGEVLDDPASFKTKEESKLSVLNGILQPHLYPELYSRCYHKVSINYYPPSGDNKEGWDNIDIFGWLGYPMQIKIDFLCRDSILAAPIVLDLILLIDFAARAGLSGVQDWLSFYFKSPMHSPGVVVEHDLFIQHMKLKNTLRKVMGEVPITHLDESEGQELFDESGTANV